MRHLRRQRCIALAATAAALLAACDTGDGKTLRDPTGTIPPTIPPTTLVAEAGVVTLPADPASDAGAPTAPVDNPGVGAFQLIAPWLDGAEIDVRHTCDGENIAPALSWVAPPAGTVELAISVVDESITNGPPFVHWVIAGIDPNDISVIEGDVPVGAVQALNFFGDVGWGGPCPPPGDDAHVYRFTAYALNQQVELADGTPATDLLDFIETVSVAAADVTGTFRR